VQIALFNTRTNTKLKLKQLASSPRLIHSCSDTLTFHLSDKESRVVSYSTTTQSYIASFTIGFSPEVLYSSPTRIYLAAAGPDFYVHSSDGEFLYWCITGGSVSMFNQPGGGDTVWVGSEDNDVRLFERDDLALQVHLGHDIIHMSSVSDSDLVY
jgi:hypothetical protein